MARQKAEAKRVAKPTATSQRQAQPAAKRAVAGHDLAMGDNFEMHDDAFEKY